MFKTDEDAPHEHDPLVEDRLQFGRGGRQHRAIDAVDQRLHRIGDLFHRMIRFSFGATEPIRDGTKRDEAIAYIAARSGRIAFGLVLITGTAVLATMAVIGRVCGEAPIHTSTILAITWLAAAAAWRATRAASMRHAAPRWPSETAGLALPTIGLMLVLPITWIAGLVVPLDAGGDEFDGLVYMNIADMGMAYLCAAAMAWFRAVRVRRRRFVPPVGAICAAAVLGSLVPDLTFGGAQVFVVFFALFCLPMFYIIDSTTLREREAFDRC